MNRRTLLFSTASLAALGAIGGAGYLLRARDEATTFEITRSDKDWRARLTPNQYAVLRQAGTEQQGSSPLLNETREGRYHCAGCDLAVYSSKHKYDSQTGWPSFTRSLANAIGTKPDYRVLQTLTEVHCRRCGGHFGHIFDDGPPPLGKRHCINGLALEFRAA